MKTIIAGSRTTTRDEVFEAMESCPWAPTTVISGTARGADKAGEAWAAEHEIPIETFPAEWDRYGRSAGHRRNAEMAENADALVLVWDGVSRGSEGMKQVATKKGLAIYEVVRHE